eukprot:13057-Heterococcus_DN1.PRE.2
MFSPADGALLLLLLLLSKLRECSCCSAYASVSGKVSMCDMMRSAGPGCSASRSLLSAQPLLRR